MQAAADQDTWVFALIAGLETAVILGDKVAAALFADRLRPIASLTMVMFNLTSIARHLGDASALLGKPEEAKGYYLSGLATCQSIRFRPEIALTRLSLAELLLEHYPVERDIAIEHLDFAVSEFESMDMAPFLERARQLSGRQPAPVVKKAALFPDGLSQREVEVLRLIAEGKSNQQIAKTLVLSPHTVVRHVSNILAKTGAANRAEAATYAATHGLIYKVPQIQ